MLRYLFYFFILISSGLYAQNKDLNFYKYAASKMQKEEKAVWCFLNYSDCQSCLGLTMGYISYLEKNSIPHYIIWKSDKLEQKAQIEDFEFLLGSKINQKMILFSSFPKQLQYRPKNTMIVFNKVLNEFDFKGVDLRITDLENIKMIINSTSVIEKSNDNFVISNNSDDGSGILKDNKRWLSSISRMYERSFLLDTCKDFYFFQGFSGKLFRYNTKERNRILTFDPKVFVDQNYAKLVKVFVNCNSEFELNEDSLTLNKQILDTTSYIKKFGWVVSNKYILTNDPNVFGLAVNFSFCRETKGGIVLEQGCAIALISLLNYRLIEVFSYPIFNEYGTPLLNYSSILPSNTMVLPVNFIKTSDEIRIFKPALMEFGKSPSDKETFTFFIQDSIIQMSQPTLYMYGKNWTISDTMILFNPQFKKIYYLTKDNKMFKQVNFPIDEAQCTGFLYKNEPLVLHYENTDDEKKIQIFWYKNNFWIKGNQIVQKNDKTLIGYFIKNDNLIRIGNGKNGKIEFKTMGKLGF